MSQNSLPSEVSNATIDKELYYHGLLPSEDVRQLLSNNGDFLLRSSEPEPGSPRTHILSVMFNNRLDDINSIKHFVVNFVDGKYFINDKMSFPSIQKMLGTYQRNNTEIKEGCMLVNPIRRQFWELEHDQITIHKKLGEGAFGEVSSGVMKFKKGMKTVQVAIKQVKLDKTGKAKIKDFLAEARTMRKLGHQNIIKFYGVGVLQEPLYLVMELAVNGALDSFLKKNEDLSVDKKTEMILQAAWGLEYIHGKPMLHRDIAARNCLYTDGKVKISDFGLTRNGTVYQIKPNTKSPIRWLAIETIKTMICSEKTDVWAYGVLCWEIFNNAAEPYPGMKPADVATQVANGYRMPPYPHAQAEIQTMMARCNAENPNDRPSMAEIAEILQRVTETPRPNFTAIAKKEAEELLLMNSVTTKTTARRKKSNVKLPKGMSKN